MVRSKARETSRVVIRIRRNRGLENMSVVQSSSGKDNQSHTSGEKLEWVRAGHTSIFSRMGRVCQETAEIAINKKT